MLFDDATKRRSLNDAWLTIRSNGIRSPAKETRDAVDEFSQDSERNIQRLQKLLRHSDFQFSPQKGVLKRKSSGSVRGIVMAPIRNRIVERALLNTLQAQVPFVQEIVSTSTSVGGVPDRSVPHGLAILDNAINNGAHYFVRSDISGFFDNIPRDRVLDLLKPHVDDRFLNLLSKATEVTLSNELALGEQRKLFPMDYSGVAQGSPLSGLFGNILLHDFDKTFNDRGIICVRFVDDFVLLGKTQKACNKAFQNARLHLSQLGLQCHDPFSAPASDEKAEMGPVENGFTFLGYNIRPGLLQPSTRARKNLIWNIKQHLAHGRYSIKEVAKSSNSFYRSQRYVQTLALVDRVLRGWADAFAYSNSKSTLLDLDTQIEGEITRFRNWYSQLSKKLDWQSRRRIGGVCLVSDVIAKELSRLPFRLKTNKPCRKTKSMTVISTDGSVIASRQKSDDTVGPGGWAAVFHNGNATLSGGCPRATNNQMELMAVIEAVKSTPEGTRILIRTDSQYVFRIAEEQAIIRSNHQLWREYEKEALARNVRLDWIRGHSGDQYNELADNSAKNEALAIQRTASKNSQKV